MPPKKANGFMMFVNEWRSSNSEGRRMTITQAVDHCGKLWSKMNAQQRGPYLSSAKDTNVASRAKVEPRNCLGQPLAAAELKEREAADQQMKMKRSIEDIVLKAKGRHELEDEPFIFAAFNFFTKTIANDIYIPAEFAACQFSLKSGKTSIYSSHVNPGHLIFGQGSDAQHHATTTHQLPLPPDAMGEADMGRLYSNIVEYLRGLNPSDENADEKKPLVVYTCAELMPVVKGCFKYLACDSASSSDLIQVYDIQYLFYVLKKEVRDIADLPHDNISKCITDNMFMNDFFEYQAGISCQYHEDNDRGKYCTQSMVTRWCYTFSDYMCGDLAIKPLPGKHMPPKQEPNFKVRDPEVSSRNTSFSSFHTVQSKLKQEPDWSYAPSDNTAFSSNMTTDDDFPSLSGRKPKQSRPSPINNHSREPRSYWNVPAASRNNTNDFKDAFDMSR